MMGFLRNPSYSSIVICFLCVWWAYTNINTYNEFFEYETVLKGDSSNMQPEGDVIRVKFLIIHSPLGWESMVVLWSEIPGTAFIRSHTGLSFTIEYIVHYTKIIL